MRSFVLYNKLLKKKHFICSTQYFLTWYLLVKHLHLFHVYSLIKKAFTESERPLIRKIPEHKQWLAREKQSHNVFGEKWNALCLLRSHSKYFMFLVGTLEMGMFVALTLEIRYVCCGHARSGDSLDDLQCTSWFFEHTR